MTARLQGFGNSGGASALKVLAVAAGQGWSASAPGSLLVCAVASRSGSAIAQPTISDSTGGTNTWVLAASENAGSTNRVDIFYVAGAASVTSITATFVTAVTLILFCWEASGILSSGALDQIAVAAATSTGPSATTPTTAQADEIALGMIQWNGTGAISAVTGLTAETPQSSNVSGEAEGAQAGYLVLSAVGAVSFGGTLTSTHWDECIATFKGVAGGWVGDGWGHVVI